jgi:hypothetical protein
LLAACLVKPCLIKPCLVKPCLVKPCLVKTRLIKRRPVLASLRRRGSGLRLPSGRLPVSPPQPGGLGQQRIRVQDVDLDVLREDAERDVDGPGGPCGIQQRPEHRLADLPDPLVGERRLSEAAPDEVPDLRDRRRARREDLRQHHDRDYLNVVFFRPEDRLGHRE